jgi:hypothetical protein
MASQTKTSKIKRGNRDAKKAKIRSKKTTIRIKREKAKGLKAV